MEETGYKILHLSKKKWSYLVPYIGMTNVMLNIYEDSYIRVYKGNKDDSFRNEVTPILKLRYSSDLTTKDNKNILWSCKKLYKYRRCAFNAANKKAKEITNYLVNNVTKDVYKEV